MFNKVTKELQWGNRKLVLETGKIARQADGAVVVSYGDTVVMCAVVCEKKAKEGIDFFPLTVHYQERAYSVGKIPGGFFRREGKATLPEVLTSRLIDRPIRPLFPEGFYNETQVICTALSYDQENDPDIVAMIAASAALAISGIPFQGPIGAARVGYIDGQYVLNPSVDLYENSALDLVVAGTDTSVLMVESEAKELSEQVMLGAVTFGHEQMQPVIQLIKEFAAAASKPQMSLVKEDHSALYATIKQRAEADLRSAYEERQKQARVEKISTVKKEVVAALVAEGQPEQAVGSLLKKLEMEIVRGNILDHGKRIDGRGKADIRQIVVEAGLLPRTHGSALFTRGETQALVVTTLGTGQDEKQLDGHLEASERRERFMLDYNFPSYSVGEVGRMAPPGRREIGHGKLAWRGLHAVLPSREEFPYAIRVVSEITESNGSSSMATVCGGSLSMMDAGVPLKAAVAGIAMGLIKEGDRYVVLSDIMGDEDHLGDMDFKVAGTSQGVTALQMDIKINGITTEIMKVALTQAQEGRMHILGKMQEALPEARGSLNVNVPRIVTIQIPKDKIREVIGAGGKVIREICETTGAKINIEDDGTVQVSAADSAQSERALEIIRGIVAEPEVGVIYKGKVVKIVDFGGFVQFLGALEGLVHISELTNEHVQQVRDVISEGQEVYVKAIGMERGKPRLSMRVVNQQTGEDITDQVGESRPRGERPERGDRGDRGERRDRGGRGERRDRGGDRDRGDYRPRNDHNDDNDDNGGYRPSSRDSDDDYDNRRDRGDRNDRNDRGGDRNRDEAPKKKRRFF